MDWSKQMNAKLMELEEEALLFSMKFAENTNGGLNAAQVETKFREKFAELIIQDCTDIVANAVEQQEAASTYVDKIKEHFGVV